MDSRVGNPLIFLVRFNPKPPANRCDPSKPDRAA
jgi:hypothetical protein